MSAPTVDLEAILKQRTRELRASESRFRQLIEHNVDGIILVDACGTVQLANPAAARLLGRPVNELVGHHFGFPIVQDEFTEIDVIRNGGNHAVVEMRVAEVGWGGRHSWLASLRDVTDRKATEELLRRSREELEQRVAERTAELVRKNQEMERFVYTVSHDLKAPLVTIQGFVGHIRRDVERGVLDRLAEFSDRVQKAVAWMEGLIDDLLDLSRLGRTGHPPQVVSVNAILGHVIATHEAQLAERGVRFTIPDALPTIKGIEILITEVFDNLLANAIHYGCSAADPQIEVGAKDADTEVWFFVRDNGAGIAPEDQEKIFEIFQRGRSDCKGTGIGLAIVRRVMELHGGRVWVESAVGEGATFWLAFPKSAGAEAVSVADLGHQVPEDNVEFALAANG